MKSHIYTQYQTVDLASLTIVLREDRFVEIRQVIEPLDPSQFLRIIDMQQLQR